MADMDTRKIGTFLNSPTFRGIKAVVGLGAIACGIRQAVKSRKKCTVGSATSIAVGAVLAGTAAADICPLNLALALPLDGAKARHQL